MSDLKKAAVELAKDGYWIFPCKPGEKEPAILGYMRAKWSVEKVEQYWTDNPDCNIALVPSLNGLVVLDIDEYKPECNWDREVPPTMEVRSARGGRHFYFEDEGNRFPGKFNGYLGVDIKHNGLVVLPPSRFEDGVYEWANELGPAELPDWMPTKVAVEVSPMAAALMETTRGNDDGRLIALVNAAPNELDDRDQWLAIGNGLHWEYHGTPLEADARQAFIDWSLRWAGGDAEQLRADAEKMWANAKPPSEIVAEGTRPSTGGTVRHLLAPKPQGPDPIPEGKLFRKFDRSRKMTLRPWLIENMLREGEIGGTSGGPGTGKTNVTATWIAGMLAGDGPAAGLPQISRPLNVAWVNAEEDVDALDLRVDNALQELGLQAQGELFTAGQENLIGDGIDGTSLVRVVDRQTVIHLDLVAAYIAELKEQGADILILDPVTEFNDGEENDRGDRKKLFRAMKMMARDAGLTVLYFSHTAQTPEGKREDWYRGNLYAERGSSAAIGALQFGATLTPMYPIGVKGGSGDSKFDHKRWREAQADASNDSVPNIVELLTVKSKMGTAKPNLFYEIRKSTQPTPDGQYLPFAEPLSKEMAMLRIDSAHHSGKELVKAALADALLKRLGPGVHHGVTAIHAQMRGAPGWPDIEKLDLDKGAGEALIRDWMLPEMIADGDGTTYRVAMSRAKDGPKANRFSISIKEVG